MTWEAWKAPHAAGLGSLWSLEVESLWKLEAQGCIGWKGWDSSFPASGRMLAPACCGIWDCTLDALMGPYFAGFVLLGSSPLAPDAALLTALSCGLIDFTLLRSSRQSNVK